jgi:hypothetical protein
MSIARNPVTTPSETPRDERASAACYIATLSVDLVAIAKRHGLDTLAYILEMARLEAESHSRPHSEPN